MSQMQYSGYKKNVPKADIIPSDFWHLSFQLLSSLLLDFPNQHTFKEVATTNLLESSIFKF